LRSASPQCSGPGQAEACARSRAATHRRPPRFTTQHGGERRADSRSSRTSATPWRKEPTLDGISVVSTATWRERLREIPSLVTALDRSRFHRGNYCILHRSCFDGAGFTAQQKRPLQRDDNVDAEQKLPERASAPGNFDSFPSTSARAWPRTRRWRSANRPLRINSLALVAASTWIALMEGSNRRIARRFADAALGRKPICVGPTWLLEFRTEALVRNGLNLDKNSNARSECT
jgi:hypothetical protein